MIANEKGLIKKDYQKWGPLIAIYTGARLNEIAQLRLDDIKHEGDFYYFDLNENDDDARLKNEASARRVPIHSKLKNLGLLEYVNDMRSEGHKRLFPHFPYSKKNGYGRNLGQWFNNVFLPKLEMKTKKLVFHSFHHTMMTVLGQNDVPDTIIKAIVGHTIAGVMHEHYFKGYTLKQLSESLEKFKL